MKRKIIIVTVLAFIIITTSLIVNATSNPNREVKQITKEYITITINRDDTLWSIAEIYMSDNYYNFNTYIKEIESINNINRDRIYAGEKIIIPVINDK